MNPTDEQRIAEQGEAMNTPDLACADCGHPAKDHAHHSKPNGPYGSCIFNYGEPAPEKEFDGYCYCGRFVAAKEVLGGQE